MRAWLALLLLCLASPTYAQQTAQQVCAVAQVSTHLTVGDPVKVCFEHDGRDAAVPTQPTAITNFKIYRDGTALTLTNVVVDSPAADGRIYGYAQLPPFAAPGTFTFTATALNAKGESVTSAPPFTVTVDQARPMPPVAVITPTECKLTLSAQPPDSGGGWKAQFKRGTTNVGTADATPPYERSTTIATGLYSFTVVWSKTGQPTVISDAVTSGCPAVATPSTIPNGPAPPPASLQEGSSLSCLGSTWAFTGSRQVLKDGNTLQTGVGNGFLCAPSGLYLVSDVGEWYRYDPTIQALWLKVGAKPTN